MLCGLIGICSTEQYMLVLFVERLAYKGYCDI
jgi:hypothetical protein